MAHRERPADSLLEGLVAAVPDAVVGMDAEFRVTVWNAAAERLYGYTREQALGRFARELATLVGDASHAELEAALARDGCVQGALRAQHRDGDLGHIEVSIRRVQDPPGYIGIHRGMLAERPRAAGRARLLLVDGHAATREAMAIAFADDGRFVVAAQAGTVAEARLALDDVDVAIVDLALPDGDGGDLIAELRAVNPDAHALVLSANVGRSAAARAVEKGAAGVLSKLAHLHQVVDAVRRVLAGETLIPLDEAVELLRLAGREREREQDERRLIESLTAREREILQLLADGLDGPAIAARLHISPRTQRNHVANILGKLRVHSQLRAVTFGLRHGIVALR